MVKARRARQGAGRRLLRALAVVVGTTAALWVVMYVALWIYAGGGRSAEERVLVIPAGTGDVVRAGGNPLELPSEWDFRSGDTLVLDNRDSEVHFLGPWAVNPGASLEVVMRPQLRFIDLFCSLHPSQQLSIEVTPSRHDLWLPTLATLMFGPLLGLIGLGLLGLARRLGDGHEPQAGTGGAEALARSTDHSGPATPHRNDGAAPTPPQRADGPLSTIGVTS